MLTTEEIQRYHSDGFLARLSVTTPQEATHIRSLFDDLEQRVGKETAQIGLLDRHFDEKFIYELATHTEVLDAVEDLIGPNFLLLATHFFCKYGNDSKFVAWHQDVTYWGLEPPIALTVWYAIDDSDDENGCMRIIPGSHAAGIRVHGKSDAKGNLLSINQEAFVTANEADMAVDLPLRAGEASLHDGAAIHCSLPNTSNRRRCGLTLRYVPTHVKPVAPNANGKRWNAVLVRGVDTYGWYK